MKDFKYYKNKLIKIYDDLNKIDLNSFFEKLKNINLSEIKEIDSKDIIDFIKFSKFTKPIISLIFFLSFFYFLLIPTIKLFNSKYKISRQYIKESRELPSLNNDFKFIKNKFKEINSSMKEIQSSIIEKDKLIYLTNLFYDLSKSTSVRIDLFAPIDKKKEASVCKISEINKNLENSKLKRKKTKFKKNINEAIYELNLHGNYLNIITFLNAIHNYEIIMITSCIQVDKDNSAKLEDFGIVKANLILKLPIR